MPRNGSGVYSLPGGSTVTNGDTSDATDINTPLEDLVTDANTARPIVAGGTGATSAADALTNLGLTATATELNYTDGVTSNIQTQLDAKPDGAGFTWLTPQTPTSGLVVTFTGIPATATEIVIDFDAIEFSSADRGTVRVQIGDAGGLETTGYNITEMYLDESLDGMTGAVSTAGTNFSGGSEVTGVITLINPDGNRWKFSGKAAIGLDMVLIEGSKTLSDTLTQIGITAIPVDGPFTFASGTIAVGYR